MAYYADTHDTFDDATHTATTDTAKAYGTEAYGTEAYGAGVARTGKQ